MFLVSIYRILKTSVISLWRNRWLALAASLIMILTLFTISFFVSLLVITHQTTDALKEKVDISVYFNDTASNDQIFSIQNSLLARSDIKSVDYISKEKALLRWQSQTRDNENVRNIINSEFNPLPRSLEIKTEQTEDLEKVNTFLGSDDYRPLISQISYQKNKELIDRLVKLTAFIRYIGWILSTIFTLISILIIYNTIRLTIFARSSEIEIMKLVGASDWYVQGPFIIEGVTYGLIGALISAIILFLVQKLALPAATQYLSLSHADSSVLSINLGVTFLLLLLVGLFLGVSCSVYAVKKYLK